MLQNRYYLCPRNTDMVVAWESFADGSNDGRPFVESAYLGEVFQRLEADATISGKTFYVTWNRDALPSYGEDVIVFLMGDEWCRVPAYLNRVGAIFRQYGSKPTLVTAGLSMLSPILFLQYLRIQLIGLPRRLRYALRRLVGASSLPVDAPQYPIPLGYGNQLDMAVVPINDRPVDAYFSGSVTNSHTPMLSLRRWLRSPKQVARKRMLRAAQALQARRPDLRLVIDGRSRYVPNQIADGVVADLDGSHYSRSMMSTKICLVPRGSAADTLRLFEAMRYGCVVIADRLPSTWFYDGAPVVTVDSWRSLETVVDDLLCDEAKLLGLHRSTLEFWRERCSGAALSRYVVDALSANAGEHRELQRRARRARQPAALSG